MKDTDTLERKIIATISQIKQNNISPKDSNIGALFKQLKPKDEALYEKLINEYKIVFAAWKKNNE